MTAQQVIDSIKYKFSFFVNYPTTPKHSLSFEDVSSSLTLTGTQTVKYIVKVTSPSGTVIYKNTGFDTNSYAVDDKGDTFAYPTITLPLATNGDPEEGAYTIIVKAQFADSAFPLTDFTTSKTIVTQELCMCDKKTVSISLTYDALSSPTTFTSTDTTSYSGSLDFYSLARTHTVRPPLASGLSDLVGSSSTLVYSSIWTGSWQSMIQSYVTFRGLNDTDATYSYFTYYCTGSDSEVVVSDSLICKMYCGLKSLELQVASSSGKVKEDFINKLNLGNTEMSLAAQAYQCDDTEKLQYFSDRFYVVTGLDPNCDCCGSDEASAPIVNSTSSLVFTIGTVTTGTAAASISGTYPNYVLNFVVPAGGGASTISPENYILDETIVNSSDTNLILFYTGTAGHYAIKEQNQIWKDVMAFGSVPSLLDPAQRFDAAEGVPVFNTGVSGDLKLRKIHDGRLHIKGYFNCPADTGADVNIIQIPLSVCPAGSSLDKIVKSVLKHFLSDNAPNTANYDLPSACYGNSNVSIKKIVGQTQFSLVFRQPANLNSAAPVGGFYVWIDEIIDLTENILLV